MATEMLQSVLQHVISAAICKLGTHVILTGNLPLFFMLHKFNAFRPKRSIKCVLCQVANVLRCTYTCQRGYINEELNQISWFVFKTNCALCLPYKM